MYTKSVPFKDLNGKPRNHTVHFNLYEREIFKLLVEFKAIFDWQERISGGNRDLSTEEVVEFYNNLEEILLSAYGVPSEDGLQFKKLGLRFDFEETSVFNALMVEFLTDPPAANALLDGLMPKDMQEMIKKADSNLAIMAKDENADDAMKAEIARLRAQVAAQTQPSE